MPGPSVNMPVMLARPAAFAILVALAPAAPVGAAAADLTDLGVATVATVKDDGTLALADGRILRLSGIDLAQGRDGRAARTALAELANAGPMTLKGDGPPLDRYGRTVAQAYAADGRWLEGELLRQGLARVATTADHRASAPELLAAERGARSHRLGLWGVPEYALRRPEEAARLIDTWQVVEGTVRAVDQARGAVYLEFGAEPASALGVRIPAGIARAMAVDPTNLAGRHVRVRGWIGKGAGPLIVLDHAEQIEIVGRARRDVSTVRRDGDDE